MKIILKIFHLIFIAYFIFLVGIYFLQEKMIFFPTKLEKNYKFNFNVKFEEINLTTKDNVNLNGLHFFANSPKGAVLFLHGNAQNIETWGLHSKFWTDLGYDFFVFDYRGYGKSDDKIDNETKLYEDVNLMFERVLQDFDKDKITVVGYSLGSGLAAQVANKYGISKLVLISAYFNLKKLAEQKFPFVPSFLVKYTIPTDDFLSNFAKNNPNSQILLFHGKNDDLIDFSNSQKLAKFLKQNDKFYELKCGHNDIFNDELAKILKSHF